VAKTTDGGSTWPGTLKTYSNGLHALHFITPQSGYTTDGIYIQKTTNGGLTWIKDAKIKSGQLIELHFTDAAHGWAGGLAGYILKYEQ
jgi:photosystem II stability/assembly factor-like uncharacterized protein